MTKYTLNLAASMLGAVSLGAQVLLIRRMMTIFYGNELIIGVVMAVWLLGIGFGSAVGARVWQKIVPSSGRFALLLILALLAVAAGVALTHHVRTILAVPFGEFIPFFQMVLFCAFLLPVPCLLFGAVFSLLASIERRSNRRGEPAAHVYTYEAVGTALFGILLAVFGHQLSALTLLLLMIAAVALFISLLERKLIYLLILLSASSALIFGAVVRVESRLLDRYWRSFGSGMTLMEQRNTRFGEIALVDWAGESWLYQNGAKVTALGDDIDAQQLAATIFCAHPHPDSVLLIEGNLGGLPGALAQFDDLHITALELDRQAYDFIRQFQHEQQPSNSRLRVIHQDARRFLHRSREAFDIIVVNSGNPTSAGANRYYTRQFFRLAKRRLADGGVLVIPHLAAGENYMGDELTAFHKIILNTLNSEFRQLVVLPGDQAVYLATDDESALTFDVDALTRRYHAGAGNLPFFHPAMFYHVFDSLRTTDFMQRLTSHPTPQVNEDFRPISYLYDFLVWRKVVSGADNRLARLFAVPFAWVLATALLILSAALGVLRIPCVKHKPFRIFVVTAAVGFVMMAANFILMLAFQTLFGYIYAWISAVIAAFMTGLALGSGFINRRISRLQPLRALRFGLLLLTAMLALLLPATALAHRLNSTMLFAGIMLTVGAIGGGLYALLCGWFHSQRDLSDLGGIYAADVVGGSAAALLLSALIIPVYGFAATLLFCGCTVVFSLALVNKTN